MARHQGRRMPAHAGRDAVGIAVLMGLVGSVRLMAWAQTPVPSPAPVHSDYFSLLLGRGGPPSPEAAR
jgi:hypothetical protein